MYGIAIAILVDFMHEQREGRKKPIWLLKLSPQISVAEATAGEREIANFISRSIGSFGVNLDLRAA